MGKEVISVIPSHLKTFSKDILKETTALSSDITKLHDECCDELAKAWKSNDHYKYLNAFVKEINELEKYRKSVENYALLLKTAAEEYTEKQSEAENASARVRG